MLTPSAASYLLSQKNNDKPPLIYQDWQALKITAAFTARLVWQVLQTKII